jgi:hypothetical protein
MKEETLTISGISVTRNSSHAVATTTAGITVAAESIIRKGTSNTFYQ